MARENTQHTRSGDVDGRLLFECLPGLLSCSEAFLCSFELCLQLLYIFFG